MAYPDKYARHYNFDREQDNGAEAPDGGKLDTELNAIVTSIGAAIDFIRGITNANGTLKNLASGTAQSLAGVNRLVATSLQTVFTTTITWVSAFSNTNVMVEAAGLRIDTNSVAVANSGGFLQVTVPAQVLGTVVIISAFEGGAGISTNLASTANGAGASLIGIEDAAAAIAATTVEGALAELAAAIAAIIADIGNSSTILRTDVDRTITADLTFSGFGKIKGMSASSANGEAVRHEQLQAVIASLNAATSTFLAKAGGTMSGPLDMGGFKLTTVGTPTASGDVATKSYVDTALSAAGSNIPIGGIIDYAGASTPSGFLVCDGAAVSRTVYAALFAAISVAHGVGDGTTTFNLPDCQGRATIGTGAGSGLTVRALGDKVGEETHVLTIAELAAHTHANNYYSDTGSSAFGDGGGSVRVKQSGSTGGDTAHNNMQPSITLKKLIRAA